MLWCLTCIFRITYLVVFYKLFYIQYLTIEFYFGFLWLLRYVILTFTVNITYNTTILIRLLQDDKTLLQLIYNFEKGYLWIMSQTELPIIPWSWTMGLSISEHIFSDVHMHGLCATKDTYNFTKLQYGSHKPLKSMLLKEVIGIGDGVIYRHHSCFSEEVNWV